MSQAVDDRWWMEWAREMLKYYPDWSATERNFLKNMAISGWISENRPIGSNHCASDTQ